VPRLVWPLAVVLFVAVGVTLWLRNCTGPEPQLVEAYFEAPSESGRPYSAIAVVRNQGRGEGEMSVVFRLIDRATGVAYEAVTSVQIRPHETIAAQAEVLAPAGRDYDLKVDVVYPPE
jgi:hypothetical protein